MYKIEDTSNSQKEIIFELSESDMEKYLDNAANRLAENMKIKGFREGNAPRKVVESTVGSEEVWKEAIEETVHDNYWNAVEESELDPIGMPKIDITKFVPGSSLEFKAVVPVMPDLDLPDYRQIAKKIKEKESKEVEVDDKEIEESLKYLQRTRAEKGEDGEEKLPELNDEFAKNLGGFESLEALKNSIKDGVREEKAMQEAQRVRLEILEKIRKETNLKVPDVLIDQETDKMMQELEEQVSSMDMTLDQYLEKAEKTMEEVKKGWQEKAEERVAAGILLRAIAENENIEVDEKEVEERANKHLAQFGSIEEAEKAVDPQMLRSQLYGMIRNEKVFEILEGSDSDKNSGNE